MLTVERLMIRYGPITAVRDVSLHVDAGEVVGVIGPNGAGKTSTLSAIFGLVRPAGGTIDFEGRSLVGLTPESVVRRGIALVPEGRHIFGTLTVGENLLLGTTPRPDRRAFRDELGEIFARFPILETYFDSPAGRLSGGEQQQLAIARALLSRPRLLLLDEPSLGLAPLLVAQIMGLVRKLADTLGLAVLLVEQNARSALSIADRGVVLNLGRVVADQEPEQLTADERLRHAYLGF